MARRTFTKTNPKATKAALGATAVDTTPVAIRSRVELSDRLEEEVRPRLTQHLGRHALQIQRVTVRFDDLNGPKGGVDMVCEIKVTLRGLPPVVVTETASTPTLAFRRAVPRVTRAVRRELDRHGRSAAKTGARSAAAPRARTTSSRARGATRGSTRKASAPRATAVLEESAGTPSRKSTRRSVNRAKPSQTKERAAVAKTLRPAAKATRARAARSRTRGSTTGRKR